jgi:hypothetical protein
MKLPLILGVVLLIGGLAAFAVPMFTTQQTKDVARIGDLHVQAKEDTTHVIPPLVSEGAIVLGAILIGYSLLTRRA